ncbi:MAG: hypothetical protein C4542_09465 [Dehalococcoidia bacterium]|nr:MAG: hypothetical protein C4542_09465 [Dehalococcoidia bacterium]
MPYDCPICGYAHRRAAELEGNNGLPQHTKDTTAIRFEPYTMGVVDGRNGYRPETVGNVGNCPDYQAGYNRGKASSNGVDKGKPFSTVFDAYWRGKDCLANYFPKR